MKTRKMWEHILWGTDTKILAYNPQENRKNLDRRRNENIKGRGQRRIKNRGSEAVIVTANKGTYAELVKRVKDKVDLNKVGVKLRNVRSTRKWGLLLTLDKEGGNAEALTKEIISQLGKQEVSARKGGQCLATLHIKGMDITSTIEELRDAVVKATGNKTGSVKVKSMRAAFGNSQNATVEVPIEEGKALIRMGWMVIKQNPGKNRFAKILEMLGLWPHQYNLQR